jgi:hypothetical protein
MRVTHGRYKYTATIHISCQGRGIPQLCVNVLALGSTPSVHKPTYKVNCQTGSSHVPTHLLVIRRAFTPSFCRRPSLRHCTKSSRTKLVKPQLRLAMIFWRPGNLNLARRSASWACA